MPAAKQLKFSGKLFRFDVNRRKKSAAVAHAKWLRRRGWNARVIKRIASKYGGSQRRPFYDVYKRRKGT